MKATLSRLLSVNLNSPSYNLSSDITRVFSPFVVPGTCLGPWTIRRANDLKMIAFDLLQKFETVPHG